MRGLVCLAAISAIAAWPAAAAASSELECGDDEAELCVEGEESEGPDVGVRSPNYVRSLAEVGTSILGGAAWYWIERDRQVADWDFPSLRDRLSFDIFVTDNNPFAINHVWHAVSGTGFHLFSRSNDLDMLPAALVGLAGSLSWEYGVEYRERISVNDIIYTAAAGLPMGEFAHWLGRYLQQGDDSFGRRVARWTVGLPQTAHDALDGRRGPRGPRVSARFHSSYALGFASASGGDEQQDELGHYARFEGDLAVGDDHLAPGQRSGYFADANFTSFRLELGRGTDSRSSRFDADAMLAGWQRERIASAGSGGLGTALRVGAAAGVRYRNQRFGSWKDRVGAVHFPGPGLSADLIGESWRLNGRARLSADYAGLHAHGSEQWHMENPDEVGKTILLEQGYYYAWGGSARLELELSTERFDLGGSAFLGRYRSQNGLDRNQEAFTIDQRVADRVAEYELWLRATVWGPTFVEIRSHGVRRSETLEDVEAEAALSRHGLAFGARFR